MNRLYEETIYECNEPRGYALKRELRLCTLCKRIIADKKYICTIIQRYDIREYYHMKCYIEKLELDYLMDVPV